ncbi:MAG TPA: adenylate kinase [Anaerolineales bacterium]|nr:adenylate kinase [Anaerolineales bacterium]HRF48068.1 adenylate kinase [Anaerolineales bacterium]
MPTYILLFGAPGAGKGTQSAILKAEYGIPHVASGDLFRMHLGQNTALGQLARAYIDNGELVPDDVTVQMIRDRLHEPDAANGAVLDGFPRTIPQAEELDGLLAEFGGKVDVVLSLKVREATLLERVANRALTSGRADDQPEVLAKRIKVFLSQTLQLEDYYRERGLLAEIEGERSVTDVTGQIHAALKTFAGL